MGAVRNSNSRAPSHEDLHGNELHDDAEKHLTRSRQNSFQHSNLSIDKGVNGSEKGWQRSLGFLRRGSTRRPSEQIAPDDTVYPRCSSSHGRSVFGKVFLSVSPKEPRRKSAMKQDCSTSVQVPSLSSTSKYQATPANLEPPTTQVSTKSPISVSSTPLNFSARERCSLNESEMESFNHTVGKASSHPTIPLTLLPHLSSGIQGPLKTNQNKGKIERTNDPEIEQKYSHVSTCLKDHETKPPRLLNFYTRDKPVKSVSYTRDKPVKSVSYTRDKPVKSVSIVTDLENIALVCSKREKPTSNQSENV
ncbi:uncharacterized protein LOC143245263 [Tachypleus tridentatus]|uniref:uncharacterized protein LOC143245263 n=1 Tax=Tachypleus tridentatus TaxID=6853 RepID=UPI003FD42293